MSRFLATVLILTSSACSGMAQAPDLRSEKGKALATSMCAQCHAIGTTDIRPHPGAPPFRTLEKRLDLDSFVDRLRENLTSGHPDMPTFRFTRDDAQALVAYLRSIQGP
jgi:mono/diheme cytochrome c family protein